MIALRNIEILLKNIDHLKLEGREIKTVNSNNTTYIEHKDGKDFEGIINYLEHKYGKNIIYNKQGIISINASSSGCISPQHVIDYEWKDQWFSYNIPNSWLEIDFKQMKVKLNGYSLKTSDCLPNAGSHLKNWVIEGSNDRNLWVEIDKQINNYDLNGSSFHHYYSLSKISDEFKYIRIRSIGMTHFNNNLLSFSNIEVFGEIIDHIE